MDGASELGAGAGVSGAGVSSCELLGSCVGAGDSGAGDSAGASVVVVGVDGALSLEGAAISLADDVGAGQFRVRVFLRFCFLATLPKEGCDLLIWRAFKTFPITPSWGGRALASTALLPAAAFGRAWTSGVAAATRIVKTVERLKCIVFQATGDSSMVCMGAYCKRMVDMKMKVGLGKKFPNICRNETS